MGVEADHPVVTDSLFLSGKTDLLEDVSMIESEELRASKNETKTPSDLTCWLLVCSSITPRSVLRCEQLIFFKTGEKARRGTLRCCQYLEKKEC